MPKRPRTSGKLALLTALYVVEGMPWGFQAKALPVYLREHHTSLTLIGLLNVLSLPWMLKVLWAPFVDRYGSARFGRRKSWIVPLQIALALSCATAAWAASHEALGPLLLTVFAMNACAATMDIAIDGLAVDVLDERELGTGNIAQVVGYKCGTLFSGGLLVWATADFGWSGLFIAMFATIAAVTLATIVVPEPKRAMRDQPTVTELTGGEEAAMQALVAPASAVLTSEATPRVRDILHTLRLALTRPGMPALFAFIATYKAGEQLIDAMFKPFLIDHGYTAAQVGLWVSTYGMGASIAGSFLGGLFASRAPLLRAVTVAAALRAIPVAFVFVLTLVHPTKTLVIAAALTENFFGGLLTTTVFALMMYCTDKRVGATHFTALSTIEMAGKAPVPIVAGALAQHAGYSVTFGVGALLSFAFVLLVIPLRRAFTASATPALCVMRYALCAMRTRGPFAQSQETWAQLRAERQRFSAELAGGQPALILEHDG